MRLTIGIPTYNGAECLPAAIDSAASQLEPGVEVVVSDNASTDGTEETVRSCQQRCPSVRYFRNEHNLGFDRNVERLISVARGDHIWLLGDDDAIEPGGISRVLRVLEAHPELALILTNFSVWDRTFTNRLVDRVLDGAGDTVFSSCDEFLSGPGIGCTFMSALILRRASCLEVDTAAYRESQFMHVALALSVLRDGPGYYLSDTLVRQRAGDQRYGPEGGLIRLQFVRLPGLLRALQRQGLFSRAAVRAARGELLRHLPGSVITSQLLGSQINLPLAACLAREFGAHPGFWTRTFPLIAVRRPLRRMIGAALGRRRTGIA